MYKATMSLLKYFTVIVVISAYVQCDDINYTTESTDITLNETDAYSTTTEVYETTTTEPERVDVHVYYETHCGFSIGFFTDYLEPVMLTMHKYIRLHLYPYGNAGTEEKDGKYVISCQHGNRECYGNKLHACAIDILKNETKSALYACCMMAQYSDDDAATECGKTMKIDADPIKECAKSERANEMLKHYGDATNPPDYVGVPHVVVNGEKILRRHLKQIVCEALTNPPPLCAETEEDSDD